MMRNSHSTQILGGIMHCKQFFSLKAVRGTAWNASAAGLQVLRSRFARRDLSKKGATQQACFYNFDSAPARLERQVASKRSKTIPAWRLASNFLRSTSLAMECQINNQKRTALLTQHTLWAYLGRKLIGVVVQLPSENILKWQLYLYEGLCSNTVDTIFF